MTADATPPPRPGGEGASTSLPSRRTAHRLRRLVAAGLLVLVTVILVLFALFNTQTVDVSLVFGNVEAPLVLALTVAAILGGLVAALAGLASRTRHLRR